MKAVEGGTHGWVVSYTVWNFDGTVKFQWRLANRITLEQKTTPPWWWGVIDQTKPTAPWWNEKDQ